MYAQLRDMIRLIAADAERYESRPKTVVYLGDYIDRGASSREVVELLMSEPFGKGGFREIFLKGNHEELMEAYYDKSDEVTWLYNGGLETLDSYGGEVPEDHRAWMQALPHFHAAGGYFFVHAGVDPDRALERQLADDLLWIRRSFTDSDATFTFHGEPAKIVHGHTIVREPQERANRIGIDTGAYATGVLTAVVLDGAEQRFLRVTGDPAPGYAR